MKPWLWLPPKLAHDLSPWALRLYSSFSSSENAEQFAWNSFSWNGIHFKNPLGIAGGVDKAAELLSVWQKIGCGFIEAGTVTPQLQKSNPGKIMDRSLEDQALWNKMGFPSYGVEDFYFNLKSYKEDPLALPVFANIGKNRDTPNSEAYMDYVQLMTRLYPGCDAFVLNISSPNTKGLRDLANPEYLKTFLQPVVEAREELKAIFTLNRPLLLKLSPDLEESDLCQIVDIACQEKIDGFILTNTTLARTTKYHFPKEGGVSGLPLRALSLKALKIVVEHLKSSSTNITSLNNPKKLIISVGGVMTASDVFERINLGADLVQVYSSLIFSGPRFFKDVSKEARGR